MGIDGTSKPWDVEAPPSEALKRFLSRSTEEQRQSWFALQRASGASEADIALKWEKNQRRYAELRLDDALEQLADLKKYLADLGIALPVKAGSPKTGEGL